MDFTDEELKVLYDRYAPVLQHRCNSILRDPEAARDAVQETFAKVIRNADTFRAQSSPLTWMYKISTNHCLNQIRNRNTRQGKLDTHREELAGEQAEHGGEAAHDHARLLALLDGVDEQTRQCVVHTYFDDCTREEVASLVGISVPTVRKRVQSFLDHARRTLGAGLVAGTPFFALLWSAP